ncbi:MAG: DUF4097 family beta strand repeat-containing protein [Sporosarcina sp.]
MFFKNKLFIFLVLLLIVIGGISWSLTLGDSLGNSARKIAVDDSSFTNIEIVAGNAAVDIVPTKDSARTVEYMGETRKNSKYVFKAYVKGDTLSILFKEKRRSFINFGFSTSDLKLFVKIPQKEYNKILAKTDNGRIKVENIQAQDIALETDNGSIDMKNVKTSITDVKTDNGKILLTSVEGKITGKTDNGRISLVTNNLDRQIELTTDNGRIEIRTEKEPTNATIDIKMDNGKVDVFGYENKHTTFGKGEHLIKLRTDNGRVTITK